MIERYSTALKTLPEEIEEAEVNIELTENYVAVATNEEITDTKYSKVYEVYARVNAGKTGFSYTQDLTTNPKELLIEAYNNAQALETKLELKMNGEHINDHIKNREKEGQPIDIDSINRFSMRANKEIKNAIQNIESITTEVDVNRFQSTVLNSLGLHIETEQTVYHIKVNAMSEVDGRQYNVTASYNASSLERIDIAKLSGELVTRLTNVTNPSNIKTGHYKVLLDKTVGVNILMTTWQLFSGLKYIDGSSYLSNKLGQMVGSSALTIVDDCHQSNTGYSFPFDCEGTPVKRNKLVDQGKFVGLMHNLQSSARLGHSPTGNAGRKALLSGTVPTDIIVTPNIIQIEVGELEEQRLLQELDDGVYITESYDVFHSINIGSGDFSIPCRGVEVKGGKKLRNVTNLTLNGNIVDLFKNITGVGDELYVEEFILKSYCVGSPNLLVDRLFVKGV